ncbi:MAG: RNA polymerase sigma-70 factor [Bacteroidales bacterium]|nr:RNA polymerase sigma-70 factor [Bacteroidales bacterium]
MKSETSNEELFILQRMIEGDENAFKYFFDTYYEDLCNFVNSYLRDEALSEDVVQDIFIYLWEKRDSLPENCSIKSYLYTASKNKSLNHLRDTKNKNRIIDELLIRTQTNSEENADLSIEFEELMKVIYQAVEGLPAQCKTIFRLSREKGLTNKEIADELGISIKTVENQMTIAIKKLKDFLQPYHDLIFILFLSAIFF